MQSFTVQNLTACSVKSRRKWPISGRSARSFNGFPDFALDTIGGRDVVFGYAEPDLVEVIESCGRENKARTGHYRFLRLYRLCLASSCTNASCPSMPLP